MTNWVPVPRTVFQEAGRPIVGGGETVKTNGGKSGTSRLIGDLHHEVKARDVTEK